ncbi:hypothetical protein [Marisediminicola antarctica]|uniref:hypothetical protein n=1 Tax=Marisediminicola antarctica TaxID=674079 RepID=UPI001379966F|nr:hypothetical protein [Marisediminicola antarctica]
MLPDRAIARILPRSISFSPDDLPPLPPVPAASTRLYIGPVNWAGQGYQWARAVRRFGNDADAVNMAYRVGTEYGFPADYVVPVGVYSWSREWQERQAAYVHENFTHVLVEAERILFAGAFRGSLPAEVRELGRRGIGVAMLCHGSDIRLPSRHAARHADSPFRDGLWDLTPTLEKQARRNLALLESLGRPVFVSTPDLLVDVPGATWLPVVIEPDAWSTDQLPFQAHGLPVVAHAPSRAAVKGSDLVDPILQQLDDEGLLRYRRVERVAASDMPEVYRSSDIVLDQFRIGSYGVAACEAMAAGRVVVSHVSDDVRRHVLEATGETLPIVEATGANIEEVLRGIIADPAPYRRRAGDGPRFVTSVHNGLLSARALDAFLSEPGGGPGAGRGGE